MGRIRELKYIADAFKQSKRQDRERRRRQRDKYRIAVESSGEKKHKRNRGSRSSSDKVMDEERLTNAVKSFPLICEEIERARKESQRNNGARIFDESLKDVIEDRYVHPSDYIVVKNFLDTVVEGVNETLLDHGMALDIASKTFIVPSAPAEKEKQNNAAVPASTTGDAAVARSETAPAAIEKKTENKDKKCKSKR